MKKGGVCVCVRLQGCGCTALAVESEHVLAQSNVWEMRSEKQMAALRMKGEGRGGGMSDDKATNNIHHLCCPLLHSFIQPPERKWNRVE